MIRSLKFLLSIFFVCALVLGLGYWLKTDTQFFVIQETPLDMSIPSGHLVVAAQLKPYFLKVTAGLMNQNIWKEGLNDLQNELRSQPWVKNVAMRRQLPNKIIFSVDLEEAIFIFVDKAGKARPVVRSGRILPITHIRQLPSRPIVRDSKVLKSEKFRKKLITSFLQVPDQGLLRWSNIASVSWQTTEGLTLGLIDDGLKIHLGGKNIRTKGRQVLRVSEYLKSQKIKGRVIDASFSKKIVVRPRKRS